MVLHVRGGFELLSPLRVQITNANSCKKRFSGYIHNGDVMWPVGFCGGRSLAIREVRCSGLLGVVGSRLRRAVLARCRWIRPPRLTFATPEQ